MKSKNNPAVQDPTRSRLSAEDVLDAALEVLDEMGFDGFTMRKLADRLEVTPMAIYTHFRNKVALLGALVELVISEVEYPDPDGDDWQAAFTTLGRSMRTVLLRHPGIVPVMLNQSTTGPNQLRLADTGYTILRSGGLTDIAVLRAMGTLVAYVMGFVALEIPRIAPPTADTIQRLQIALGAIAADEYPTFVELAPNMTELVSNDQFEYGLSALLAGVAADQARTKKGS